jgi:hypothetical protein
MDDPPPRASIITDDNNSELDSQYYRQPFANLNHMKHNQLVQSIEYTKLSCVHWIPLTVLFTYLPKSFKGGFPT